MEHLYNPERLVASLQKNTLKGGVVSVPDPEKVDVFGMDVTHVTAVGAKELTSMGFTAVSEQIYGGVFSNGENDALLGYWLQQ